MTIIDADVEMAAPSLTHGVNNLRTRLPSAFYDSKTTFLLGNPVVNQRGESVELENVEQQEICYPNRALMSLIASEVDFIFEHPEFSKSSGLSWVLSEGRELPDQFYCPITRDFMMEPVISPDGYTFEREAIENWIQQENGTCPITRKSLKRDQLRRNLALQDCIQTEILKPYDTAHFDVKRWKDAKEAARISKATSMSSPKIPPSVATMQSRPGQIASSRSGHLIRAVDERARAVSGRKERALMMGVFFVGFLILILLNALQ